jgi:hypothetical protein
MGMPNMYLGDYESKSLSNPYVCLLSVIPLKVQADKYVFTLTLNGVDSFRGKVGTVEEFINWFHFEVLWSDVDIYKNGGSDV